MKNLIILCLTVLFSTSLLSQTHDNLRLCMTKNNLTKDEQKNVKDVRALCSHSQQSEPVLFKKKLRFPVRIGIVQENSTTNLIPDYRIQRTIEFLNKGFKKSKIEFYIAKTDVIVSDLKLESLAEQQYEVYNNFSDQYDLKDTISLFVFNYRDEFCTIDKNTISCGRTGGFSYILSEQTNNIIISRFDLEDYKILAHEFGHFFGLYHTFDEGQLGKDDFSSENCAALGDGICDTPPDPGTLFEIYVNYSTCEMSGLYDKNGKEYKPLIDNFMSYYKPCYLREYSFTQQQSEFMRAAALSSIRSKFIR